MAGRTTPARIYLEFGGAGSRQPLHGGRVDGRLNGVDMDRITGSAGPALVLRSIFARLRSVAWYLDGRLLARTHAATYDWQLARGSYRLGARVSVSAGRTIGPGPHRLRRAIKAGPNVRLQRFWAITL